MGGSKSGGEPSCGIGEKRTRYIYCSFPRCRTSAPSQGGLPPAWTSIVAVPPTIVVARERLPNSCLLISLFARRAGEMRVPRRARGLAEVLRKADFFRKSECHIHPVLLLIYIEWKRGEHKSEVCCYDRRPFSHLSCINRQVSMPHRMYACLSRPKKEKSTIFIIFEVGVCVCFFGAGGFPARPPRTTTPRTARPRRRRSKCILLRKNAQFVRSFVSVGKSRRILFPNCCWFVKWWDSDFVFCHDSLLGNIDGRFCLI